MQISLPTDTDGFITQTCPSCQQHFKIVFGEGSEEPLSFCPYCGFEGNNCWLTQAQEKYVSDVALNVLLKPELKKLEQSLGGNSGSFLKVSLKSSLPEVSAPPMDVDGDFEVFRFMCCNETIKAERHEKLFCVICGKEMDLKMSDSKKIFLSHKGVDKQLVKDFKETLQLLGYDPWLDDDAMPAGTSLERGILKGMQDSCAVVFFITPSFRDENFLETEIDYAINEKRNKGDKFSIIILQFVYDDGNVGEVPELLKKYVWKKPTTNLQALREIIRALPVQVGEVDWREGIEGVVQIPKVKSKSAELSLEARTILLEASSTHDGIIHQFRYDQGTDIQVNGKSFIPTHDHRTIASWDHGLEELERRGFIKDRGHKREVFELTHEGYEAADEIRARDGVTKLDNSSGMV